MPNFLHKDRGIRITLAPKSQRALLIANFLITQGIEILSGSLSFGGSLFLITTLHYFFIHWYGIMIILLPHVGYDVLKEFGIFWRLSDNLQEKNGDI